MATARADYYVYVIFRLNGEPCYVGKGCGNRYKDHARGSHNKWLARIYAKSGNSLPLWKAREGLTDFEASATEMALISALGRKNKKTGPLANLTDGGEGMTGYIASEETRKKLSAANRGVKHAPERVAKMAAAHRGKKQSPEAIAKMVATRIGVPRSEATREALRVALTGKKRPELGPVMRRVNLGRKHSPESCENMRLGQLRARLAKAEKHADCI